MNMNIKMTLLASACLFGLAACSKQEQVQTVTEASADAAAVAPTVEELEAAVPENPLKDAYFGETHVHTSYSLDAYIGGARLTPDEAYKFA
jgi:Protein of unknown function (DUF3604)